MDQSYLDIQYSLIRSRRKTACIIVGRDGRVTLRVPMRLTVERVEQFIESKRTWIHKHLAAWRDLNASRVKREYVNGEEFLYLGRIYRLKIVEDQAEPLLLKGGYFCLRADGAPPMSPNPAEVFKDFYRRMGIRKIPARVAFFQERMGVSARNISIAEGRCRWASCSAKGNLRFHWKCMMTPTTVIDYLVVHELAHLIHHNHSADFWNEVAKILSDYRERDQWLKVNGVGVEL
jgi:predicted metal-dependent hydrolase